MTQQEADELAVKPRLIWVSEGALDAWHEIEIAHETFYFHSKQPPHELMMMWSNRNGAQVTDGHVAVGWAECWITPAFYSERKDARSALHPWPTPVPSAVEFANQWMAFLRRGCFLSGCVLECSEHEKLEWTLWLRDKARTLSAA